jgi:hypothetical protein
LTKAILVNSATVKETLFIGFQKFRHQIFANAQVRARKKKAKNITIFQSIFQSKKPSVPLLITMKYIDTWLSGLGLEYVIPKLKAVGITTPKKLAALSLREIYEVGKSTLY